MPRSVFVGRPLPGPGEPLFTEEDTAAAIALAEEEQDACPSCGMPKAWCRDPANQFAFETHEETCWPSWRLALRREALDKEGVHEATRAARQMSARFREQHLPDIGAGLDLVEGQQRDQEAHRDGDQQEQRP